jgi:hypothetical protein
MKMNIPAALAETSEEDHVRRMKHYLIMKIITIFWNVTMFVLLEFRKKLFLHLQGKTELF